ncbi:MAG: hypothetical protein M0D55_07455 [Elusimicrobiota bacterium]|nr:MAG: hypothetical protein M0D55_07455 [Elusimicrobiota bacterium]
MSGSEPKKDLSKLTPEDRAALVAELTALVGKAGLRVDEEAVMRHILAHAGLSEAGLFLPSLSALWGATRSYFPSVPIDAERVVEAVRFLRRRGILREAEGGSAFVDGAALRELADKTSGA